MKFTNVRLILSREVRDQLRDRRTLFMIFVLPVLLYPLMGASLSQMLQVRKGRPINVAVLGNCDLATPPHLFEDSKFSPKLLSDAKCEDQPVQLQFLSGSPKGGEAEQSKLSDEVRQGVRTGEYDVAIEFPPDFVKRLEAFRHAIREQSRGHGTNQKAAAEKIASEIPRPNIIHTTANTRSQSGRALVCCVLEQWRQEVGKTNLEAGGVPPSAGRPFTLDEADVAEQTAYRGAAIWAKILPVFLLVWAMTGAFYPAVDLCAGEKERGTLETLLCSPAERSEIVLGKLLTVLMFSMATASLNLLSVGATGCLIFGQLEAFSPPSPLAVLWLAIALVPVSLLFSALCLASAAFARSTKEGQYYLMPLLLITLPLALLPMQAGVELTLGNSLIPITGIVLLLGSVLEGSYWPALQYAPVVVAVTLAACWLAVRWAVDQFNSESVLFRESERFDLRLWLRHLRRDRQATPTAAVAVCCGVAILLVKFLMGAMASPSAGLTGIAVLQIVAILGPVLLMTGILTRSPRQTLLLRAPRWQTIPAVMLLALAMHPIATALRSAVVRLYPISDDVARMLEGLQATLSTAKPWQLLVVMAIIAPICEELAFRGFMLSGFRHLGDKWRAIFYSAIFFGMMHSILQQSIVACFLGVVLGYIAVQSGSILPGIVFHVVHNSLSLTVPRIAGDVLERWPALGRLLQSTADAGPTYSWQVVAACSVVAAAVLAWFAWLPFTKSAEEELQDAIGLAATKPLQCCLKCGE